jgi:UDP-N-acetyl-D-galactosamine dehydrogenase
MTRKRLQVDGAKILVLGLAFKENCPDVRNTRVIDIVSELSEFNCQVEVYDPWVNAHEAAEEYGITLVSALEPGFYDAIVIAVAHRQFRELGIDGLRRLLKSTSVIYDLKYVLPADSADLRL